jgi:hypothetical protein
MFNIQHLFWLLVTCFDPSCQFIPWIAFHKPHIRKTPFILDIAYNHGHGQLNEFQLFK